MKNFRLGDHLVTNIDLLGITEHHGIYIGNGEVVHRTGEDRRVMRTSLEDFCEGKTIRVKKSASSPKKAVANALAQVGTDGYNLFAHNCEHFVNECIENNKHPIK